MYTLEYQVSQTKDRLKKKMKSQTVEVKLKLE